MVLARMLACVSRLTPSENWHADKESPSETQPILNRERVPSRCPHDGNKRKEHPEHDQPIRSPEMPRGSEHSHANIRGPVERLVFGSITVDSQL